VTTRAGRLRGAAPPVRWRTCRREPCGRPPGLAGLDLCGTLRVPKPHPPWPRPSRSATCAARPEAGLSGRASAMFSAECSGRMTTLSRRLPASPLTRGSACLQLQPVTAMTGGGPLIPHGFSAPRGAPPVSSITRIASGCPSRRPTKSRTSARTRASSQLARPIRSCIPPGPSAPACSAIVQQFLTGSGHHRSSERISCWSIRRRRTRPS